MKPKKVYVLVKNRERIGRTRNCIMNERFFKCGEEINLGKVE